MFPRSLQVLAWGIAVAFTPGVSAQITAPRPDGVTSILLNVETSFGPASLSRPSRVSVPVFEQVNLVVDSTAPIQWTKDGTAILGATARTLTLPFTTSGDRGLYNVTGLPAPLAGTGIKLDVADSSRFGNFSARLEIPAGAGARQIIGFVVAGTTSKSLLVRAVGPSLKSFGLTRLVTQPEFAFFDAKGRPLVFAHPANVIDWKAVFTAIGAFPLTEQGDVFDYASFDPGTYTIQLSDRAALGGTVLLEIYELPPSALANAVTPVVLPPSGVVVPPVIVNPKPGS